MLRALIFDVDGTLADTERDGHRLAFNMAFRAHNLDWDWDVDTYAELLEITGGKERITHYARTRVPQLADGKDFPALVRQLHSTKTECYLRMVADGNLPLRPGVIEIIQAAKEQDMRLAIATTTHPENVKALLLSSFPPGADKWFEVIAAGDIVPAKKPAPDIYLHVLETMQIPASDCLAVEDSANGLHAALSAGIPTIVTPTDYTRQQNFHGALTVIPSLGDTTLEKLIKLHSAHNTMHIAA